VVTPTGTVLPTVSRLFCGLNSRWLEGFMGLKSLHTVMLILALAVQALPAATRSQNFTFRIPPQRIPVNIGKQPITITASGIISVRSGAQNDYVLKLQLDADLSDLQQNVTGLLRSQLDKADPCGDHIAIQHATIVPVVPVSRAVVQLHYARYTCVRVFRKRRSTKLIAGDGVIQMKFTPTVEDRKTLRLVPDVESIQANGSLGQLLRAGPLGAMIREKITKALVSAMQKGTDRSLTVPPAVQDIAAIDRAQFADEGAGHLGVVLEGSVVITPQQIQAIETQLKRRIPTR
jgi:hypothetical protein